MIVIPTTPGTSTVANADSASLAAAAADALADRREHVEEDEHEQERLHQRADRELGEVLSQHDQVAQDQREQAPSGLRPPSSAQARSRWAPHRRGAGRGSRRRGGGHQSRSSLPVSEMNTVSRLGSDTERSASSKPPASAALTTRGTSRSAPLTCSSTPPSTTRVRVTSAISPREPLGERLDVAVGLDGDDRVGADRALERLGRVEREDPAVVHDRHALAELVGLLHVVGGEQDRLPLAVELAEDLPQRQATLRVKAGGRLVEEQHRRAVEDRARHHQALGHAARQRVHRRLRPFGEVQLLEQLVGDAPRLRTGDAEQATVEVEVLPHRQLAVERVLLGDDPDQLLGQRGVGDDVDRPDVTPSPTSGSRAS